ncbi:FecR family protein [Patescibacteria group bacterium]|nr:FecR family protein [Patescibacteria group bacterium]
MRKTYIVGVMFIAFLLFAGNANAQNISDFATPLAACKYFGAQPGFSVLRNLSNDCLVRNGENNAFVYTHFYDSGNNFCLEVTTSIGRVFGPQCMAISQTGRTQQASQGKLATTPSFQLKQLQYDHLPSGKPIQSDDNERIDITMPDGSLIQLDANSTFTPVSDHEVQSVFGRYRYQWQPFHDGNCIVGQNLVRQACRKVKTRDAILGITGTEFLVETNEAGTTVTVLEGSLMVSDLNVKKTVEVSSGQYTYIKHGGLPEDPKPFDAFKLDRWWQKKTAEQVDQQVINIITICAVILAIILIIIRRKAIFLKQEKRKAAKDTKSTDTQGLAISSFILGLFNGILALSFSAMFWPIAQTIKNLMLYPSSLFGNVCASFNCQLFFLLIGFVSIIMGIMSLTYSKKYLAVSGIVINLLAICLWHIYF